MIMSYDRGDTNPLISNQLNKVDPNPIGFSSHHLLTQNRNVSSPADLTKAATEPAPAPIAAPAKSADQHDNDDPTTPSASSMRELDELNTFGAEEDKAINS